MRQKRHNTALYITITAKFGQEEYTTGALLHAKFGRTIGDERVGTAAGKVRGTSTVAPFFRT